MNDYAKHLAERAIWAWRKEGSTLGLNVALHLRAVSAPEPPANLSANQLRDFWQTAILEFLAPTKAKAAKLEEQRSEIARAATRLNRFVLETRQPSLETYHASELPDDRSERGWLAFLGQQETPSYGKTIAKTSHAMDYPSLRRLGDVSKLIASAAPIVARRVAAEMTLQKRIGEVFAKYGFKPGIKDPQNAAFPPDASVNALADRLHVSQRAFDTYFDGLTDEVKERFKNWPAAAVAGSFSNDLAAELDYMPSVWALERELGCIKNRREVTGQPPIHPGGGETSPKDRAWDSQLMGLAFSGGGIRSATFNLGILQGLAKLGLLRHFDYLSTVSGGGYIGSWLINWIKRAGLKDVENRLSPDAVADPRDARVAPIRFLRDFSNYLTPRLGLLSADLWIWAVVWFRNTVLNLLGLLPALLAFLLLPRLMEVWAHAEGMTAGEGRKLPDGYALALGVSVVCAATFLALNLRQFRASRSDVEGRAVVKKQRFYLRPWSIFSFIVLPIFIAAWISSLELWSHAGDSGPWKIIVFAGAAAVSASTVWNANYFKNFGNIYPAWKHLAWIPMIAIVLAIASVTSGIVYGLEQVFLLWPRSSSISSLCTSAPVTVFGLPTVVFALFLIIILTVGFMGRSLADGASKWLSRLRAYIAIYSTIWLVWVGISVYGSAVDYKLRSLWYAKWPALAIWGWTTLRGVLAGKDPKTAGGKSDWKTSLGFYATVGPYVFIVGLLFLISFAAQSAIVAMEEYLTGDPSSYSCLQWVQTAVSPHPWFWAVLICFLLSALLAGIMSLCVDVNEFSLNTLYRGRLVRAYLGAANTDRHPNPFTGFDTEDDHWALTKFKTAAGNVPASCDCGDAEVASDIPDLPYAGPFPIFNTTVNLVHGDELAWQERKGASFCFTPEVSGFETPWNAATNPRAFRNMEFTGYRETCNYAYPCPGIHLGTPVSVSGAAASPNMGSYTRAATGFLMTVFNARLGWWLGNPRHKKTWKQAGPTQGLAYLLKELLGLTNERAGFVYLSDGGHFENLAIYELVRRRCRFIVACDAEEDVGYGFNGLGNAIRKCREDFGVEITLHIDRIKAEPATGLSSSHCVVGTIQYPDQAGVGYLLYIKSSIVGDEPEDVLQYRVKCPAFPHQTTGDQWFTESQFESYRRLGLHIAETSFQRAVGDLKRTPVPSAIYAQRLFEHLRDDWYPPSKAILENFTKHAHALDELVREMRSDDVLIELETVLIPVQGAVSPTISPHHKAQVFLFLSSVIQLMENIYIDLDLEANADHPHNAGWIEIFRAWAQDAIFQEAWRRYGWTYGSKFRRFCTRQFGLQES